MLLTASAFTSVKTAAYIFVLWLLLLFIIISYIPQIY